MDSVRKPYWATTKGRRGRMMRTPEEGAEDYSNGGLQKHGSCFLQLLWSVSGEIVPKVVWIRALTLPIPMARSETPPRPLRQLRLQTEALKHSSGTLQNPAHRIAAIVGVSRPGSVQPKQDLVAATHNKHGT